MPPVLNVVVPGQVTVPAPIFSITKYNVFTEPLTIPDTVNVVLPVILQVIVSPAVVSILTVPDTSPSACTLPLIIVSTKLLAAIFSAVNVPVAEPLADSILSELRLVKLESISATVRAAALAVLVTIVAIVLYFLLNK